jgi:putative ABC transport system permease protein
VTADLFFTGVLQGLVLSMVAYGIMLPFRLLNFPDLTSEGAYPLGGAVYASCVLIGIPPVLATLVGAFSAGLMGIGTSLIHLRLRVNTLLAGIILSTMIYSINLQIMQKPNLSLFNFSSFFSTEYAFWNIAILVVIVIICIIPLGLFLYTDLGLKLRAVGLNPDFAKKQGISITRYTILGLFLAGCLSGLGGCLMVALQRYMDIGMGVGIVIHGLAALMLGEAVIGNKTIARQLLAPLIGSLIYQQIQGVALTCGLRPSDLKFFTGALVLIIIACQKHESH